MASTSSASTTSVSSAVEPAVEQWRRARRRRPGCAAAARRNGGEECRWDAISVPSAAARRLYRFISSRGHGQRQRQVAGHHDRDALDGAAGLVERWWQSTPGRGSPTTASDEFLVRLRYWLVSGGMMTRRPAAAAPAATTACQRAGPAPRRPRCWPKGTDWMPARTTSAM